jgi:hypothetical protein
MAPITSAEKRYCEVRMEILCKKSLLPRESHLNSKHRDSRSVRAGSVGETLAYPVPVVI